MALVSWIILGQVSASTTRPGTSSLVASHTLASPSQRALIVMSLLIGQASGQRAVRSTASRVGAVGVRPLLARPAGKRIGKPQRDRELGPGNGRSERRVRRTDPRLDRGPLQHPRQDDQARADDRPAARDAEVVEAL